MIQFQNSSLTEKILNYATLRAFTHSYCKHKNARGFMNAVDDFFKNVKIGNYCIIKAPIDGYCPPDPNDRLSHWVPTKWGNVFVGKIVGYIKPEVESSFFSGVRLGEPKIMVKTADGKKINILSLDVHSDPRDIYAMRFMLSDELLEELHRTCPANVTKEFFYSEVKDKLSLYFTNSSDAAMIYQKWTQKESNEGKEYLESRFARNQHQEHLARESQERYEREKREAEDTLKKIFD